MLVLSLLIRVEIELWDEAYTVRSLRLGCLFPQQTFIELVEAEHLRGETGDRCYLSQATSVLALLLVRDELITVRQIHRHEEVDAPDRNRSPWC